MDLPVPGHTPSGCPCSWTWVWFECSTNSLILHGIKDFGRSIWANQLKVRSAIRRVTFEIKSHHDETRVYQDERAGPPDAGGAVDNCRAHALVQTAAVPDGAEELEEGVCGGGSLVTIGAFLSIFGKFNLSLDANLVT